MSVSKVPQDVWEMIKSELVRVGLEKAEITLSKEAAVELREGTLLDFVGKDEPSSGQKRCIPMNSIGRSLWKRLVVLWVLSKKRKVLL